MLTVVAFYTRGGGYESDAELLAKSLEKVGMDYAIKPVGDHGDWDMNTAHKADFVRDQRKKRSGPLLYLDVDAFVHRDCTAYFEGLAKRGYDFAAHFFAGPPKGYDYSKCCACLTGEPCDRSHRMLSGTLFFGDTAGARSLLDVWAKFNAVCQTVGWKSGGGQRNLWAVVASQQRHLKIARLPGRYCYVFDRERAYPEGEPRIIEHTLASHDHRGSHKVRASKRGDRIAHLRAAVC